MRPFPKTFLAALAALSPLAAQMRIQVVGLPVPAGPAAPAPARIPSGQAYRLVAIGPDGHAVKCRWTLEEPSRGTLSAVPGTPGIQFLPLAVSADTEVHLWAVNPSTGERANLSLTLLLPRSMGRSLAGHGLDLVQKVIGSGLDLPHMRYFPGETPGGPLDFGIVCPTELTFVDDPAMGPLDQTWVCHGLGDSLWVLRPGQPKQHLYLRGKLHPDDPGGTALRVHAMAVRPEGSGPDNPRHMVLMVSNDSRSYRPRQPWEGAFLCTVDGTGLLTPIAGGPGSGSSPAIRFESFQNYCMVMDRSGVLTLAKGSEIFQVGLDNVVRQIVGSEGVPGLDASGRPKGEDGKAAPRPLQLISAIAVDEATKDLYILEAGYGNPMIHRIAPDGTARTLAHSFGPEAGRWPPLPLPGEVIPEGGGFMHRPRSMVLHRNLLYLCDQGNLIWAFEPGTGILHTLAGDPGQRDLRPGPLRGFAPRLGPGVCAAIGSPQVMAFHGSTLIVATQKPDDPRRGSGGYALIQMDVPEDAFLSKPGRPEEGKRREGPAAPRDAPAAPPHP